MQMELNLADIVHEHKMKADIAKLKLKKIKQNAVQKENCLCYALARVVILEAVVISLLGLSRCM